MAVLSCLTEAIFTQADNWEELRRNVKEAIAAYYFDQAQPPAVIRLRLLREELFANRGRLARDLSGSERVNVLRRDWGYRAVHQEGSHVVSETEEPSHQRIAVPAPKALRVGTAVIDWHPFSPRVVS
jgi:predicted RNA binding protein YcfA (HicA-like mRNA interferase family)